MLLIMGAERPLRILCARETQASIAESVHQLLSDQIVALGLEAFYDIQNTVITGRNGTTFSFAGIRQQSIANLKSYEGVDICWVEEAQVVTAKSWKTLIPTIRKPGSEIWISFNPELDTDETYQRFVLNPPGESIVIEVNYSDNPWFPGVLEQERKELLKRDPVGYQNVWLGKCRPAVEGAIYFDEIDALIKGGRFCNVPYDPLLRVHTVWDLGNANNMRVIFVQRAASEIRVIDHIPGGISSLPDYVAELEARKYRYGIDYIPHDGRAKQSGTGKSTEEMLQAMGRTVEIIPASSVEQGIQAAKTIFPRLVVDKNKCIEWVNSIKRYRRVVTAQGVIGGPLHDDASHDADTLRYLALRADAMSNDEWGGELKYPKLGYR